MNIDEILNMIDDMLEEAWSLPFSGGRCVVDAQKVKECVEDIRLNLPGEIKQAKMIVADRNDIIKGAERQAESTLRKAEERARMLIAQEEIVKQLEQGEALLEDPHSLFEEGTKLMKKCSAQLDRAEQKVTKLLAGPDGAPVEEPFQGEG